MAAFAQIKALLGMDTKGFEAGMKRAGREMKSFQTTVSNVGRALGVAFSVGAIVQFSRHALDTARNIKLVADNLGITTDELQAINNVFRDFGLNAEQARDRMGRLVAVIAMARDQNPRVLQGLKALGISVKDFAGEGATAATAAELLGQGLARLSSQTDKISALTKFFSEENAPRLVQALEEIGIKGVDPLIAKYKGLNEIIGAGFAARAEQIQRRGERAKTGFGVFGSHVLDQLFQGGTAAVNAFKAATEGGFQLFSRKPWERGMEAFDRTLIKFAMQDSPRDPDPTLGGGGGGSGGSISRRARGGRGASARQQAMAARALRNLLTEGILESDQLSRITGPDARVSQLESIGGQTGINRGMLPIAQRQLKVLEEIKRTETRRDQRDERILDALFTIQAGVSQTTGGLL